MSVLRIVRKVIRKLRKPVDRAKRAAFLEAHRDVMAVIDRVRAENKTYLERDALIDLAMANERVEREKVGGVILEAGCALGGSALVAASVKDPKRPMYVYDTFEMIPPPSEKDPAEVHSRYEAIASGQSKGIGDDVYYGYQQNLYEKVHDSFAEYGMPAEERSIHLVKGLFQDTLRSEEPVALAHIDCDWYESVMTCLERIAPRVARGGVMIFDDYDAWGGAREAVEEYFRTERRGFRLVYRSRVQMWKE